MRTDHEPLSFTRHKSNSGFEQIQFAALDVAVDKVEDREISQKRVEGVCGNVLNVAVEPILRIGSCGYRTCPVNLGCIFCLRKQRTTVLQGDDPGNDRIG